MTGGFSMPLDLLTKLPKHVQDLINNGTYTLYRSKNGHDYFLETEKLKGYLLTLDGKILKEDSLDLDSYEQLISFSISEITKKVANG
jgi:hypothetical protein